MLCYSLDSRHYVDVNGVGRKLNVLEWLFGEREREKRKITSIIIRRKGRESSKRSKQVNKNKIF